MTSSRLQNAFRFRGFRLDVAGRQLSDSRGEPLPLGSRAFDTLCELVRHAGQTLSKDDLMNAVWPGVVVEENNLNQAISSLRKALGDSKSAPRFIQTIPGRGYRFVAPVEVPVQRPVERAEGHGEPAERAPAPLDARLGQHAATHRRRYRPVWVFSVLVVLLTASAGIAWQHDGGAAAPAQAPAQAPAARVGMDGVADPLPTESFDAYRYLLAAKNAYYFQNYAQTFSLTREAIALDPQFIEAHFYFATVNTVLAAVPLDGMSGGDHQRLAMESAQRIIDLAPEDSRGYTLKATALATIGDWEGVAAEVERLTAMGVSLAEMKFYGHALLALGDFDGAIEIFEANQNIEPVNLYGRGFLMAAHEMAGRPNRARQEFLLGEELSPVWWGDTVNVFIALGRNEPLTDIDQLPIPQALKGLLQDLDDRDGVLQALDAYRARGNKRSAETVFYSAIAAYVGERELAVALMREALDGIWLSLHWMWLPVFDEARQLPAFRALLVEAGVVAYWERHGWPPMCRRAAAAFHCERGATPVSLLDAVERAEQG